MIRLEITTIPPRSFKHIAVIAFIFQYEFAIQIKGLQQSLCHADIVSVPVGEQKAYMDSRVHPLPHRLLWSSLLCSVRFPRDPPPF